MEDAALKNTLKAIVAIVREQHVQSHAFEELVLALRAACDSDTRLRLDELINANGAPSAPYQDDITRRLDRVLQQLS